MARRATHAVLAAGALAGLQACATPAPPVYAQISESVPFGYRDRPSADGGLTVLAVAPGHSSLAQAQAFWDRRAQELCPGGVAKRIIFRAERREFMAHAGYVYNGIGMSSRGAVAFEVEGYAYCKAAGSP